MRIEALTVALRPRSAWEAVELGTALVRRHAGAIWKPWLWLTLPVFVLLNALTLLIDAPWLAGVLMWWLKPVFDRVPVYVLSRAVFGDVPTTRQTLREQWRWGTRWLFPYLTWRRLSPVRSLYLPVDLLEGGRGEDARRRRSALGGPVYGVAALLTLVCVNFELAVYFGAMLFGLLFVPDEYVTDTLQQAWTLLETTPAWLFVLQNALAWLATTLIEPFYVGAGFGLYLNRRTEIEAWDIEMVLRRLRARLTSLAPALMLCMALSLGLGLPKARAQEMPEQGVLDQQAQSAHADALAEDWEEEDAETSADDDAIIRDPNQPTSAPARERVVADDGKIIRGPPTLPEVFGPELADDASLRKATAKAYADPRLSPKQKITQWKPRDRNKPKKQEVPPPLASLGQLFALIGEYGLWVLAGTLVLILLITSPRWVQWLRRSVAREGREPNVVRQEAMAIPEALPDDIPSAVRKLWRTGQPREALALLYRASVEAMSTRIGVALVPGATEAQCLRASRQLPSAEERDLFARMVRMWQYAAYAHGLPEESDFDSLLTTLSQRFGWSTRGATV